MAHQIGSSVGLSILVAIAGVSGTGLVGSALEVARINIALDVGTGMLLIALIIVLLSVMRPSNAQASAKGKS